MTRLQIERLLRRCRNWNDFKSELKALDRKGKGDCFEALTRYYLQLHPKYATKLKKVWLLSKVPPRLRRKLNLPGPDEGIDLIAETHDGEFWAIQCKYREDETKSLSRRQLSTFTDLALNICNNIDLALVCTTANRFSHKFKLYGERLSFCAGDQWRELDKSFFRDLRKLLASKPVSLKPLKPRPHQKRALRNAQEHFVKDGNSRGKLIMPCATGKSLTGYWCAEKLKAKSILIAVPSLALIRQTLETWTKESVANKRSPNWIVVCSDESVRDFNRDDPAVLTHDLGVRVNTDPKRIASWLRKHKGDLTVVFTTYQSGLVTAEAAKKARVKFDLGIMDEAHKTTGKKASLFSHLLHDKNIKIKHRIFMTATERRYRGGSEEIASMDDPQLYGDTFELLSFKKALESKPPILSDYKILTILVSQDDIAKLIQRNLFVKPDKGRWDSDIEADMLACLVALRKAIKDHDIKHAVSFHSSIARAKAFQVNQDVFGKVFRRYGKLETFHVSGKTPTAVRSDQLDMFSASKRSLITNARCLTEGVDVPNIDCVLFADPKKSTVDIVQAIGRALRVAQGKKFGYVLIPVLVDREQTDRKTLQTKAFESVLIVLRALAANDERIVEYFRTISQGQRRIPGTDPFVIDVPLGVEIDAQEFVESVELQLWSRLAKLSWMPFEEAREFVHSLGLKNHPEWNKYYKGELPEKGTRPKDIPTAPNQTYKDQGWLGWGDWLGTGTVASQLFSHRSFKHARKFVHSLGLKSQSEWYKYCNGELPAKEPLPEDIPSNPHRTYRERGWISMGDWLGTGYVAHQSRRYRPFRKARKFVRTLGLKNGKEWLAYGRGELPEKGSLPEDIPAYPNQTYKNSGWVSMGDWLGTGAVANYLRQYRQFKQARKFVRGLGLKNQREWNKYRVGELSEKGSVPEDIPSNPSQTYKNKGWTSWGDWLGTGSVWVGHRQFLPFKEARKFVHTLGLQSPAEWRKYCKGEIRGKARPNDIPSSPDQKYKNKGWVNWGDWLGTTSSYR